MHTVVVLYFLSLSTVIGGMMNFFTGVCVESEWGASIFILKPQELSKPAPKPQPPRGFALRLRAAAAGPGGSIESH
jgi:hypothetical protein